MVGDELTSSTSDAALARAAGGEQTKGGRRGRWQNGECGREETCSLAE